MSCTNDNNHSDSHRIGSEEGYGHRFVWYVCKDCMTTYVLMDCDGHSHKGDGKAA